MAWLALFLLVSGAIFIIHGVRMDGTASFEDGTFAMEMFFILFGGCAVATSLVLFNVWLFINW